LERSKLIEAASARHVAALQLRFGNGIASSPIASPSNVSSTASSSSSVGGLTTMTASSTSTLPITYSPTASTIPSQTVAITSPTLSPQTLSVAPTAVPVPLDHMPTLSSSTPIDPYLMTQTTGTYSYTTSMPVAATTTTLATASSSPAVGDASYSTSSSTFPMTTLTTTTTDGSLVTSIAPYATPNYGTDGSVYGYTYASMATSGMTGGYDQSSVYGSYPGSYPYTTPSSSYAATSPIGQYPALYPGMAPVGTATTTTLVTDPSTTSLASDDANAYDVDGNERRIRDLEAEYTRWSNEKVALVQAAYDLVSDLHLPLYRVTERPLTVDVLTDGRIYSSIGSWTEEIGR
jgi:hypothetical protein